MNILKSNQGKISVGIILFMFIAMTLVLAFMPILSVSNIASAKDMLEDRGYIVLSATEYATINTKLDNIKISADIAVIAAQNAVIAAQNAVTAAEVAATKVDLFNSANVTIFPDSTNKFIAFTSSSSNNTWSDWVEIVDNNSETLSSKFATQAGYIADMYLYYVSTPAQLYSIEIAYGSSKTEIARVMFAGTYMDIAQIKSRRIPAGSTLYYRMMCNTAPAQTVAVGFRYFYE